MTNTNTVNILFFFFLHITSGVNQNQHLMCHTVSILEVYNNVNDCRSWKLVAATRRMSKKFRKKSGPRRGKKKVSNVAERNEISSWMYVEGKRGTDGGYKRK